MKNHCERLLWCIRSMHKIIICKWTNISKWPYIYCSEIGEQKKPRMDAESEMVVLVISWNQQFNVSEKTRENFHCVRANECVIGWAISHMHTVSFDQFYCHLIHTRKLRIFIAIKLLFFYKHETNWPYHWSDHLLLLLFACGLWPKKKVNHSDAIENK